ncbi:MAG: hypothetical protein L0Z62_22570 [Gemmataceae bacterium]|nr:hypothetical protein [Gemmataceae bacterium]
MTPLTSRCLLASGVVLVATLAAAQPMEPITPEQFKQLQTVIKPAPTEARWAKIPIIRMASEDFISGRRGRLVSAPPSGRGGQVLDLCRPAGTAP